MAESVLTNTNANFQAFQQATTYAQQRAQAAENARASIAALIPDAQAAANAKADALIAAGAKADALIAAGAKTNAVAAAALLPDLRAARLAATATAGLIPHSGGDHTTIPAGAGVYRIMTDAEAGQVWERVAGGGVLRRPELEAAAATDVQAAQALAEQADSKADSASNALGNLTLAELSTRPISAGPQLADGSRWVGQESGIANGGTVVPAFGGGVWVREFAGPVMQSWFMSTSATPAQNRAGLIALMAFQSVHFDVPGVCRVAPMILTDLTGMTVTSRRDARLEFTDYLPAETRYGWRMTGTDFAAELPEIGHEEFHSLMGGLLTGKGITPAARNSDAFYRQVFEELTDAELFTYRDGRNTNVVEFEDIKRFNLTCRVRGSLGCGPFVADYYDGVAHLEGFGTIADVCTMIAFHPETSDPNTSERGKAHVTMIGEYGGDDMSFHRYWGTAVADLTATLGRAPTPSEIIAGLQNPPPQYKRVRGVVAKCINKRTRGRGLAVQGIGEGCRIEYSVSETASTGVVSVPDTSSYTLTSGEGCHIYGNITHASTWGPEAKGLPAVWVQQTPNIRVDADVDDCYEMLADNLNTDCVFNITGRNVGQIGVNSVSGVRGTITATVHDAGQEALRVTGAHSGMRIRGTYNNPGAAYRNVYVQGGQRLDLDATVERNDGKTYTEASLILLDGVASGRWAARGYGGEILQSGGNVVPMGVNGSPYFAPDFVAFAPQQPDVGSGAVADAAGLTVRAPDGYRRWTGAAYSPPTAT